jgi:ubiquitin C-terminal hydrolase
MYQSDHPSTLYELLSVAVHLGTINGGHYVAYCRKEDGQWYFMDDERVGKVSLQEVLEQDAYMLFYRRVESELGF